MLLPKNNKWKDIWLLLIIPLEILDFWSTYINVVLLNGEELSPIVNWAIQKWGAEFGVLVFVPVYKAFCVASIWIFLTFVPYSNKLVFRIFPKWRTIIPKLKKYSVKYLRFVMRVAYISACLIIVVRLSAVVFNFGGALNYIHKYL